MTWSAISFSWRSVFSVRDFSWSFSSHISCSFSVMTDCSSAFRVFMDSINVSIWLFMSTIISSFAAIDLSIHWMSAICWG